MDQLSNTPLDSDGGIRFKLQNGLNAILYSLESQATQNVKKLCEKNYPFIPRHNHNHCVVAVEIEGETVWLVFYCETPEGDVINTLKSDLETGLDCVYLAVYNNHLYDTNIELVTSSIKHKNVPQVTAVLHPEW